MSFPQPVYPPPSPAEDSASDVIRKVHGNRGQEDCGTFPYSPGYARIMNSETLARPKRSGTRKKKQRQAAAPRWGAGWVGWWPLLVGIAVTLVTVKTAEILPLMGADGLLKLRLLYPYALLLRQPQLGLSEQASDSLSQMMLYAQFPLYGLYTSLAMKWKPLWTALMQVAAIHLLGFGVLWLLTRT